MNRIGDGARPVVVIGLDGTPYSFLKTELDAGNLPHLGSLFSGGRLSRMETEIPAISSVAWASFMTGVNPGVHGIFGFTDRRPGTYELSFPNYSSLRAEPLWDRLSREGGRCCVLNVPSTYPARPLNGVLVSGFVAPNLEKAVYPREAYDYLSRSGYRVDADASLARESLDALLEDLHDTLEKRREAILHFYRRENWDFFMSVFTGTDRLHHFLWRHYEEDDPVYKPEFMRYYQRLDEIVGEIFSLLPEGAARFMLSDHGFCSIRSEVYLNALLKEGGLLSFRNEEPKTIADIDPVSTQAYCLDPGRISLNLAGREPGGIVKPGMAAQLTESITRMLLELKDPQSGAPVIAGVRRGSEIYSGPQAKFGPDLVAVPHDGYDLKGRMTKEVFMSGGPLSGMHTHDDAFVFVAEETAVESPAHIRDLASRIEKSRYRE